MCFSSVRCVFVAYALNQYPGILPLLYLCSKYMGAGWKASPLPPAASLPLFNMPSAYFHDRALPEAPQSAPPFSFSIPAIDNTYGAVLLGTFLGLMYVLSRVFDEIMT